MLINEREFYNIYFYLRVPLGSDKLSFENFSITNFCDFYISSDERLLIKLISVCMKISREFRSRLNINKHSIRLYDVFFA